MSTRLCILGVCELTSLSTPVGRPSAVINLQIVTSDSLKPSNGLWLSAEAFLILTPQQHHKSKEDFWSSTLKIMLKVFICVLVDNYIMF
ncbi:hypothetical protein Trydic_g8346 [Trypoxylus dichotomus]